MDFSVGILYDSQELLKYLKKKQLKSTDYIKECFHYHLFGTASPEKVLELCQKVDWIKIDSSGNIILSSIGNKLLACESIIDTLRNQLMSLINDIPFPWASRIPFGREETLDYLPVHIYQCFKEANLIYGNHSDIIEWWDILSMAVRRKQNDQNLLIGRQGERFSFEYEKRRTGKEPIWVAIESNLTGYDLISIVSKNDNTRLLIEVKATSGKTRDSYFHLSRKEANIAKISKNYIFHLWEFKDNPKYSIIPSKEILNHIPKDTLKGEWELVKIPFNVFEKKLFEYNE